MAFLLFLGVTAIISIIILIFLVFFTTTQKKVSVQTEEDNEYISEYREMQYENEKEGFFLKLFHKKDNELKKSLSKANDFIERANFEGAKDILINALYTCKNCKNIQFAYLKLADIAMSQNDEACAIRYYIDLSKKRPEYRDLLMFMANLYMQNNKFEFALEIFEKLKSMKVKNLQMELNILHCKSNTIKSDEVEETDKLDEEYKNFAKANPKDAKVNYETANYFAHNGDLDCAFEYCQNALNISPNNLDATKLMGLLLLIKGDLDAAKQYLNVVLRYDNKNMEVINLISYIVCSAESTEDFYESREKYFEMIHKMLSIS